MKADDHQRLINAARDALRYSYCPYSKFPVGAAVLTEAGHIITGSNIENSSYSLSICAERVALFNAISQGENSILAVAIVSGSGTPCPPCGSCRQVIAELAKDAAIIFEGQDRKVIENRINELLPLAFGPEHLCVVPAHHNKE